MKRTLLTAAALLAAATQSASADVVFRPTPALAIYAGGRMSADQNVIIRGHIAGSTGVSLNQSADVSGDLLTRGDIWLGQNSNIDGRLVAGRDASLSQRVNTGAIDAGRTVWIDQNSTTGRVTADGSFSAGRNVTVQGGLRAAGSIWMDQNTTVERNISYGSTYSFGKNAKALGDVVNRIVQADEWSQNSITMPSALPTGSESIWMPQDSSQGLKAGAYGSLSTGNNVSIDVGAGEHAFTTGWLAQNATLNADTSQGDVYLVFSGAFSTGNNVRINNLGDGQVIIQAASVSLGQNTIADADLFARSGNASLGAGVELDGRIFAHGDVHLGQGTALRYAVPAPGGAALLALSALIATRRKRA